MFICPKIVNNSDILYQGTPNYLKDNKNNWTLQLYFIIQIMKGQILH